MNGAAATGEKLYEERLEGARVAEVLDLSNQGASAGLDPEVQGVARVSEDGSHAYFVAKAALASEPDRSLPSGHQTAVAGEDNLYVYERDTAHPNGQVSFVATLAPGICTEEGLSCTGDSRDWDTRDERPVQATPDGELLVFQSAAELTPDDTSTVAQIFEYDAGTGELARVSIGQQGEYLCKSTGRYEGYNCDGNTEVYAASIKAPEFTTASSPVYVSFGGSLRGLSLSEDGADVFFSSTDALTPAAREVGRGAGDVYEYHWGEGGVSAGNVQLLLNSQEVPGERDVEGFTGTDASGEDAFISTPLQLVGQATDTQESVYDARIDGGFPAPVFPAECSGEACQGAPGGPPALLSAASTGAPAVGNLTPAPTTLPSPEEPKPKPLTNAQKLTKAIKGCKKDKNKTKRTKCEKHAKKLYGQKAKAKSRK